MLDKLIQEGESLRSQFKGGDATACLSGEDYEKWIAKCIIFLENDYPSQTVTDSFLEASKNAVGNFVGHYYKMMGIMKALKEMEQ